jgi:hypothetical protein
VSGPGFDIAAIGACIPRRVRVGAPDILDLGHRGATTAAHATAKVGTAAAAVQEREDERGNKRGPAEPQESSRSLCLSAVLLKGRRAVGDAVVNGVVLSLSVCLSA